MSHSSDGQGAVKRETWQRVVLSCIGYAVIGATLFGVWWFAVGAGYNWVHP